MKPGATSSPGLPRSSPPNLGGGTEEATPRAGTPDHPPSPSAPGPGFGEPPPLPFASGPRPQGAGGRRRALPPAAGAPPPGQLSPPPGRGLPGSNRLSIQRPVARSPGRARPTPPGRSPGLDFATFPTPEGKPGGKQTRLGGRGETRRPPATAAAGETGAGAELQPRSPPGVAHLPPASQVAHSSSRWQTPASKPSPLPNPK